MSSIEEVFEDGKAFISFTVGGYPDKQKSKQIVETLVEAGADIIELGIPFSDPMADGPTIQRADQEALEQDVTADDVLEIASEFPDTPVVLLCYANTLHSYGYPDFFEKAEDAEVEGLIVPDMPPEEFEDEIGIMDTGVDNIFLVAQNTPEDRIERIESLSQGFTYLVSVKGTTGARRDFGDQAQKLIEKTEMLDLPRCIGFGISEPEHVETAIEKGADGVIVGSALIDAFDKAGIEGLYMLALRMADKTRTPVGQSTKS